MVRYVAGVAILAAAAAAQTEYFPLHPGNQWVYRSSVGVRVVEIDRTEFFNGRSYALLRNGFSGDAWLRMDDGGTLYAYNPQSNRESPWVNFAARSGDSFETSLDPCNQTGVVVETKGTYTGPAGEFNEVFQARYPAANCADAGLDYQIYGKWIGLIEQANQTIAGPRVFRLIYARIGGVTVLSERELSFGLTLDRSVYTSDQAVTARLTLRHSQPDPLEIVFSSGQTYDIVFRNEKGEAVYRWSDGKFFTQALRRVSFPAGEKNWVEVIGPTLPAGKYVAEAGLTAEAPVRYAASVSFEVK